MTLKEAISILRDYETPAAIVVLSELRKLKAEKAAMWRAFGGNHVDCGCGVKCSMENCPLLRKKVNK